MNQRILRRVPTRRWFAFPGTCVLALLVSRLLAAPCLTPGPDLGNHYCSGIDYDFTDITASGTPVSLADDEVSGAIPIGFPFSFYGVDYTELYIGSNGFLTVLPGQSDGCCAGEPQPTPGGGQDGLIAGLWENLYPPGGTIHHETVGTAPERVFIVQFTAVPHFGSAQVVTFEFKLFERSNAIEVHYAEAPGDGDGSPSALGIENQTGTIGLAYAFGDADLATPAAVRYTPGTRPAYVRSTAGPPWGQTTNENAMDRAFGAGNWDDLRYETVPLPSLFRANRGFVYLEGSHNNANELEAFLGGNQSTLEAWVADGRCLFINSAPNEGNGMGYAFGGVTLTFPEPMPQGNAVNPAHPIFHGPFTPVAASYFGDYFAFGTVSGGSVSSLIDNGNLESVLAEKGWGMGFAGFGGMSTDNFHVPQPEARNLRANILHYLSHHDCVVTPPFCGNGILEGPERCDDGNNVGGDCCSANCRLDSDADADGFCAVVDNCPLDFNPQQEDLDGDGEGNACDHDDDNDAVADGSDCAPLDPGAFAVPGEVMIVAVQKVSPTAARFDHTSAGGGSVTLHDAVTGPVAALPVGPGGGDELALCGYDGTAIGLNGNPARGEGSWLIFRGKNACGAGTYGARRANLLPPFPLLTPRMTTTCP